MRCTIQLPPDRFVQGITGEARGGGCLLHNAGHAAIASSYHAAFPAQSLLGAYLLHQLLLHVIVLPRQVLQLLSSFLHGPVGELGAVLASL